MVKTRAGDVVGTPGPVQKIIRPSGMPAVTGYSLDYIYELVRNGMFPPPLKLGARASGWLESDVATWQAERIAARDGKAA